MNNETATQLEPTVPNGKTPLSRSFTALFVTDFDTGEWEKAIEPEPDWRVRPVTIYLDKQGKMRWKFRATPYGQMTLAIF